MTSNAQTIPTVTANVENQTQSNQNSEKKPKNQDSKPDLTKSNKSATISEKVNSTPEKSNLFYPSIIKSLVFNIKTSSAKLVMVICYF